ncbi:MAG: hypothetical protein JJ921_00925 [Pseudomonadales bacterium]|nr:hypothetical protein [Pseudomonadales bacterium]MBO7004810.1 hypothetical protein [Pseudomonadales bacterium]
MSSVDTGQLAHDEAVGRGEFTYVDPSTGYHVFTTLGLQARGKCCGCGCRHCPFQHESVPMGQRAEKINQPAWLTEQDTKSSIALFWSGGKDSFLALRALRRDLPNESITLVTTFDLGNRIVAHQEIHLQDIVAQASALGCPLLGIPLATGADYVTQVKDGLELIAGLKRLAFGDLHLEHIRDWREEAFSELVHSRQLELIFPLWQVPYQTLLEDLSKSGVTSVLTAVTHPELEGRIGEKFDQAFIDSLSEDIDTFGENGEFHTRVEVA